MSKLFIFLNYNYIKKLQISFFLIYWGLEIGPNPQSPNKIII